MKESRTRSQGENGPRLKPVDKIELSPEHKRLRLIFAAVFLVVGAFFIAYGVSQLSAKNAGWNEIEVSSSESHCGDDFVFQYCLGEGSVSATAENKALTALYSEAAEYAFQVFSGDTEFEGVHNLYYISCHPNEEIEVDDVLYQAFALLERFGDRSLYLAPVYEQYNGLFKCTEDYQAMDFDPYLNQDLADYYATIADFANDTQMINLELLGENRVCLKVAEAYLSFAQENEIEKLIDFYWMKNAFIVDYFADLMVANGYTKGYISSYDGFFRNLDPDISYSFNLYDWADGALRIAGQAVNQKVESRVFLRSFPVSAEDAYYYQLENGEIRFPYLDAADGLCKSGADGLVSYSNSTGCAEILMNMIPAYIGDSMDDAALRAMQENGIYSIYVLDSVIRYNDADLTVEQIYSGYSLASI